MRYRLADALIRSLFLGWKADSTLERCSSVCTTQANTLPQVLQLEKEFDGSGYGLEIKVGTLALRGDCHFGDRFSLYTPHFNPLKRVTGRSRRPSTRALWHTPPSTGATPPITTVNVVTLSEMNFEDFPGFSSLATGSTVSVKGLLFNTCPCKRR